MTNRSESMSPYQEALDWIRLHPGTGSAGSMAKLVLSFWNCECAYPFRECIGNLDGNLTKVAVRMAAHFAQRGEDQELTEIGHQVCKLYPRLWEMGQVMDRAKRAQREEWDVADRAASAAMYREDDLVLADDAITGLREGMVGQFVSEEELDQALGVESGPPTLDGAG